MFSFLKLQILLAEKEEPMIIFLAKQKLCHCYLHDEQFSLSLQHCQEALDIQRTADVHCDKAEVYIATEMYDEGELFIMFWILKHFDLKNFLSLIV